MTNFVVLLLFSEFVMQFSEICDKFCDAVDQEVSLSEFFLSCHNCQHGRGESPRREEGKILHKVIALASGFPNCSALLML